MTSNFKIDNIHTKYNNEFKKNLSQIFFGIKKH